MTASPQLVREARRLQHQAVEQLLEVYYPQVYRMAYGLCGRVSAGRTALRLVMIQCLRVLPVWQRDQTPEYWFSHHTLLACRHAAQRLPDPRNDLLVQLAQTQDPTYIAFVQAVRALPLQQREAFILHHGEKFSLRQLGIAMDCSVDAASHHLHAASLALIPVSDGRMDELARELARAYARLTPGETVVLPAVHEYMRRHYWPRRVLRMVHWILTLALWAVAGWGIWQLWQWAERHSM